MKKREWNAEGMSERRTKRSDRKRLKGKRWRTEDRETQIPYFHPSTPSINLRPYGLEPLPVASHS